MKIALLGGSFDPPHLAHTQVVQFLIDENKYDQIWVLPTRQNPLKTKQTSFENRLQMCRLAFADFGDRVVVRDDDQELTGYTIELVKSLLIKFPKNSFTFVGGSDLKQEIPHWKESKALQQSIAFEFLPRPPDPASPFLDLSSTQVRDAIASGQKPEKYLPKKVAEFVKNKQLYASCKPKK